DVRPASLDLPLEVVHGTEPEDLVPGEAQHVGEGAALDVVVHPARPAEVRGKDPAVVVVLAVQGRMQARDDLDRQGAELVVLAPVYGEDLGLRHAAGAGEDGRAFGADHGRAGLPGDVWHVERVVEVRVRVEDEIRLRDPGVDGGRVANEVIVGPEHAAGGSGKLRGVHQGEPSPVRPTGTRKIH